MKLEIDNLLNLYIQACIDYYYLNNSIMHDSEYDKLAAVLLQHYDKLPLWFKEYVPKEEFENGGYVVGYNFGSGKWKYPH